MSAFSSGLRKRLTMRWTGPLFLVPILFMASLVIESWMQESGLIAYIPVGSRSSISLWRMAMISVLVNTPLSVMFMAEAWKGLAKSGGVPFRGIATAFSSLVHLFIVILVASALALPPLGVPVFQMTGQLVTGALLVAFWSVSTALLCSVISGGAGGAVLSMGLFAIALFPGLAGNPMNTWFAAPLGGLVTDGLNAATVIPVILHGLVYLLLGSAMLARINR